MQITEHDSISDLQRLAKRTQHGRTRLRIQGIILERVMHFVHLEYVS